MSMWNALAGMSFNSHPERAELFPDQFRVLLNYPEIPFGFFCFKHALPDCVHNAAHHNIQLWPQHNVSPGEILC